MFNRNYKKSNSILATHIPISDFSRTMAQKILKSKDTIERQHLSEALLDELCDMAEITICKLNISDAKQYHKKSKNKVVFKQYGYYKPNTHYIYIHNKTAVRGQILAAKTFLDTLLHEWLHHYDHQKLGLNSIHTAGFYARLKDIKEKVGYFG